MQTYFHLSVLVGHKEPVLTSLNGKVQSARVQFSRHNFPDVRAMANRGDFLFFTPTSRWRTLTRTTTLLKLRLGT